ncbi:MAG: hypothetical protein VYB54_00285 [Pseudomonadota bacterium]|nr:hypothetical protein [Pseudomonadota bacterium]
MPEHRQIEALEKTQAAIRVFARREFQALGRKVIYRLQRIGPSGIFADDLRPRTLWDEYCHEVRHGPHSQLDSAWEQTLTPVLDDVLDRVPRETAVLLTIHASWDADMENDPQMLGSVSREGLRDMLLRELQAVALRYMDRGGETAQ